MASIKISELNSLFKKDYEDLVPIVDVSANETKKISIEELVDNNVDLIAVSSIAPSECEIGDKYYNTNDNLIYTAIDDNTWSDEGENAVEGIMYIVFEEQTTYAYDGETLISVGSASGSVVNNYSTSITESYSCNYVNSIIESGSNANGNWIKYNDGTMICYRTVTGTVNINQAWGSLYYGDVTTEYNFAQEFIETPNVQLRAYPTASASFWIGYGDAVSVTTTSSYKNFALLRPTSYNNLPFKLDILAIGKWK